MAGIWLLLLPLLPVISAAELCQPGQVIELDDSTFHAALSECSHVLVDFYAPWCWHCKALAPQLEEVAIRIERELPHLRLAKVDADKYRSINSKFKISEYPTLKLFTDGVHTADYNGPHQAEAMVEHLKKLLAPEISTLPSLSGVEEFLKQAGTKFPVFVGFGLQSSTLSQLAQEYKTRAWFAVVNLEDDGQSGDILTAFTLNQLPALIVQHVSQQEQQTFYGPFHEGDAVTNFVKRNLLPAVTILAQDNLKVVKADGRPILLTVINSSQPVGVHENIKALVPSHPEFVFALLNTSAWPAFADTFHSFKLLVWTGESDFYTSSVPDELDNLRFEEQVDRLVRDFRDKKAKRNATKQPPFKDRMLGFLAQNFMYVLLFVITVVVLLQGMEWGEPRPTRPNQ